MDNHEEILDALTAFGKNPNPPEIPPVLEQYLNAVAKNGETLFSWSQLKPLILRKMEIVFTELRRNLGSENIPNRPNVENVRFDVIHARIIDSLHKFNGAPFTIQRLCELLTDPKRHYKRSDKFMRGLEKNVLVVSTVDPFGRKVVCEAGNKPMLNGILDINGSSHPPGSTGLSVPLPPVPGWVNTGNISRSTSPNMSKAMGTTMTALGSSSHKADSGANAENDGKDSVGSSNVPGDLSMPGSVFSDQGDPLAVQSEEVVEETVVTMDTSDVSSVVTDGGEGMAEREVMEADMTDDREASSFSSSSSSSSEELSTSFENSQKASQFDGSVSEEPGLDEHRPWAAFAQDVKPPEDVACHPPFDNRTVTSENQTSNTVSSSSPPHKAISEASTLVSTSSSTSSLSSSSSTSAPSSDTSLSSSTVPSKEGEDETSEHQDLPHQSSSDQTNSREKGEQGITFDTTMEFLEQDDQASSTSSTTTNTSGPTPLPGISTSTGSVPTYAQVVASSTDTSSPIHLTPYHTTETVPCDSVAGLERLVGSMEQSLAAASSSSSSSSSSPTPTSSTSVAPSSLPPSSSSSYFAKVSKDPPSSVTTSSSASFTALNATTTTTTSDCCSSEDGEPVSKRLRLSTDHENFEDCISTSGVSCPTEEEEDGTANSTEQQAKEEVTQPAPSVHSSMEGEDKGEEEEMVSNTEQGEKVSETECELDQRTMEQGSGSSDIDSAAQVSTPDGDEPMKDSHMDNGDCDQMESCPGGTADEKTDTETAAISSGEAAAVSTTDEEVQQSSQSDN